MSDGLDIRDTYIALTRTALDRIAANGGISTILATSIADCDAVGALAMNLVKAAGPDITVMIGHLQQVLSEQACAWANGDFDDWLVQADAPAAFLASRV